MSEVNQNEVTNPVAPEATAATAAPVAAPKKTRKPKEKKPTFGVPGDKFGASETPGFDVTIHAKLKPTDFKDPLDFLRWEVWYYTERAAASQREVDTMLSLGSTPEERKEASEELRLLKALEKLAAKRKASGNSAAVSRLSDKLGDLFQKTAG